LIILLKQFKKKLVSDKLKLSELSNKNLLKLERKSHGGEIYKDGINKSGLLDFSTNINHLFELEPYMNSIIKSLTRISRYPDSDSMQLKNSLVKYFQNRLTPNNLIISGGSMDLINIFVSTFVQEKDKIVVCQPTFSEYEWAIKKCGGVVINEYRLPERNFQLNFESLEKQLAKKPKCVFICNPNNPNGYLDNIEAIEDLIYYAKERKILVLLDEAFIEFTGEENSLITKVKKFENLFVIRSFTKFFGIPGLRIGFGGGNPKLINFLKKVQTLWPVNNVAQELAEELLNSKDFIKNSVRYFQEESKFVSEELAKIKGLKIYPTSTNYLLINTENTSLSSKYITNQMLKHNILVRDCSNYNGLDDYYIRVAIKSRDINCKLIRTFNSVCN